MRETDIVTEDRIDDEFPHSLEQSDRYGLRCFKVKVHFYLNVGIARLKRIGVLLADKVPEARITIEYVKDDAVGCDTETLKQSIARG